MSALVIVGSEVESAGFAVLEVPQHHLGELDRPMQLLGAEAHASELQHRIDQEGVVVQIGGEPRSPRDADGQQPAVAPMHAAADTQAAALAAAA